MTYDLATVDEVAEILGMVPDPSNERLASDLRVASDIVRIYTGQRFDPHENDVVALDGTGTDSLQLLQVPVVDTDPPTGITVAMLDYNGVEVTNPTWLRTRLDPSAGLLYRIDSCWPIGRRNIVVTYSHGYLMPGQIYTGSLKLQPLPDVVRGRVASIAANLYTLTPSGTPAVVNSKALGNFRVGYDTSGASDSPSPFAADLAALASFRVVDAA